MQAWSHRYAHNFQSSHNLVYARSQGSFRLVMGLSVKVWSIWLGDFTSSKHCCNHLHLFASSFHSFSFETSNIDFLLNLFGIPFISSLVFSIFIFPKNFHHNDSFSLSLFYKEGFLLFVTNFKVESPFIFLYPSLGFHSSFLSTPST